MAKESVAPTDIRAPRGEDCERTVGFLTDATLCIGCKACQVACKQWNGLPGFPDPDRAFEGYDHTLSLSARDWRHVAFAELPLAGGGVRWSFLSDVCKHCTRAGCLDACPTTALVRTEEGGVVVRGDVCNGCAYCVASCPFGVVGRSDEDGRAHKCTLCYDRTPRGLEPACVKACPTDSILFGPLEALRGEARARLDRLHAAGGERATLWGERQAGGLHALFVLDAEPEAYGLPRDADSPSAQWLLTDAVTSALACVLAVALLFWGLH